MILPRTPVAAGHSARMTYRPIRWPLVATVPASLAPNSTTIAGVTGRSTSPASRRALDRLATLKNDPERRRDFAIELLRDSDDPLVIHQALAALGEAPPAEAREPLRRLLQQFSSSPKRDPGGLLRAAILGHLDQHLTVDDLPLIEKAVVTVEWTPTDNAGAAVLRAAALVALDRLDPDLAVAHAAVMLANAANPDFTSQMTGEPATTAARVLAARDQWPALLLFVQAADVETPAEPLFEAIRGLDGVPEAVLAPVIAELKDPRELILLGLCDLVVAHRGGPRTEAWLAGFLRGVSSIDIYRYLLAAIVASRRHDLFEIAAHSISEEFDRNRLAAALETLPLAVHEPAAAELLKALQSRLR